MANKLTRFTFYDMYWNVNKKAKGKMPLAFLWRAVREAPPQCYGEDEPNFFR